MTGESRVNRRMRKALPETEGAGKEKGNVWGRVGGADAPPKGCQTHTHLGLMSAQIAG